MKQLIPSFPPPVRQLAGLLGEALGGEAMPPTAIDSGLVTLALRRHEVGGLLHAAARSGRHAIAADDLAALTPQS